MSPRRWTIRRVLKRLLLGILGILVVFTLLAVAIANSQDGSIMLLQRFISWQTGTTPNSFAPRGPTRDALLRDGVRGRTNLRYAKTYPNSFLDIWYPSRDDHAARPTVLWIHGGGWFAGTKETGDPFAGQGHGHAAEPVRSLVEAGFDVVNLDYALAPEYRYPVPMNQLNDALGFLADNASRLGLDMHNIVIMGGSAGAQMSAQYGALLSDPAYAAQVGIKPAIAREDLKGVAIWSAPLRTSGFGWRMNAILWSYLGTKNLETSPEARQLDILSHVNANYPPTYITDGNQPDTFPEHAKAMVRMLRENKVHCVFNYHEESEARLGHTYTGEANSKYGRDNINRTIAFIREQTGALARPGRPEQR